MKTKKTNKISVLKYALLVSVITFSIVATASVNVATEKSSFIIQQQEEDSVYGKVDEMPEFPGGMSALGNYLGRHISYPVEAKDSDIEGRVYVSFVIDKEGGINKVKIEKSIHPLLDEEAKRVILGMPKWKAGKNKGKKVSVIYVIPVRFKIMK